VRERERVKCEAGVRREREEGKCEEGRKESRMDRETGNYEGDVEMKGLPVWWC